MRRREFIAGLGGAAAWPLLARAQQSNRVRRIGWLASGSPTSYRFSLAAFRDGLRALNYVEGQNINIEYRWAEGNLAQLPELAKDLVDQKVDIILAGGSSGAEAAMRATSAIPIVNAGTTDLVQLGLVKSLARPGGNLTGFVGVMPDITAKRLQIMLEIKPETTRVAILRNPTNVTANLEWEIVKEFAATNNIALALHDAYDLESLAKTLTTIPQSDPDIFVLLTNPFVFTYRKLIIDAVNRFRLASIYGYREFVDDGGVISYGANTPDTYRRAAEYVDKIFKGAKPADLPVQMPTKFELVINLKTAKALDLEIPPQLLARADEVIE
jgi:putative tryptophan/tyrosine transport system substrate-binding protein